MKIQDLITKKIEIAEKRIIELMKSGDLKKLSETDALMISKFFKDKSKNRLDSAKLIYSASQNSGKFSLANDYNDYAEAVASAYYSMYYIVHSFLALKYRSKLSEDIRGVHAITEYIILYYLVKTKRLAKHLYEEYTRALETTAQIQKITIEDFQEKAFEYVRKYDKNRSDRETFTYTITKSVEEYAAIHAIKIAEEFINIIKQIMAVK